MVDARAIVIIIERKYGFSKFSKIFFLRMYQKRLNKIFSDFALIKIRITWKTRSVPPISVGVCRFDSFYTSEFLSSLCLEMVSRSITFIKNDHLMFFYSIKVFVGLLSEALKMFRRIIIEAPIV